jgi:hypothetical protein
VSGAHAHADREEYRIGHPGSEPSRNLEVDHVAVLEGHVMYGLRFTKWPSSTASDLATRAGAATRDDASCARDADQCRLGGVLRCSTAPAPRPLLHTVAVG